MSTKPKPKYIVKKYGKDFHSNGGALTLNKHEVSDVALQDGKSTKTHNDGWTITGVIHEDDYYWVNEFSATHPRLGFVKGDFEKQVRASSEKAFKHFWKHHQPEAWDYGDI